MDDLFDEDYLQEILNKLDDDDQKQEFSYISNKNSNSKYINKNSNSSSVNNQMSSTEIFNNNSSSINRNESKYVKIDLNNANKNIHDDNNFNNKNLPNFNKLNDIENYVENNRVKKYDNEKKMINQILKILKNNIKTMIIL